ncbi:MAG: Ig-like domain-containing protein, partial [Pseudomonadota bacterium]
PPAPPAPDVPPVVLSSTPGDGDTLNDVPTGITVVFSKPMEASLVSDTTVQLDASGGDASFDDGNQSRVTVAALSLAAADPASLQVDLTGIDLPDDTYRLRLVGAGATALADTDGLTLDGNADGIGGDDGFVTFTLDTAAPPPEATWRGIQDAIFTPQCVVCHVDGGQASFLPLDEASSYDALVGVPSTEVPTLLRVEPLNANDSYLVQKLEGTAAVGARMPLGGDPLPSELIDAVRGWIETGAVRQPGDPVPDVTPPLVVVSAPSAELSGTVTLVAEATDASGVASVEFLIDGQSISSDSVAPYEATLDTTTLDDGPYTLEAEAQDSAGNVARSQPVAITVANVPPVDDQPPSVSLASPGAVVSGTVTLSAAAADNVGVALVRFFVDGDLLGVITEAPYSIAWDTGTSANGTVVLTAQAQDAAGNTADADRIQVQVDNAPPPDEQAPTVTLQVPASPLSGTVTAQVDASDNVGVIEVRVYRDATVIATLTVAPYAVDIDTTLLADGDYALRAEADDAAGNTGLSSAVTVTVDNAGPGDVTPPTVTLSDPGDPLIGTVTLMATASDDVGVVDVSFLVDGAVVATDVAAPYEFSLDTTTLSDGPITLLARARDGAGNVGESSPRVVTVDNADRTRPELSLSVPAGPVTGNVDITVTASDDVAVAQVSVTVDGLLIGTATAPPYVLTWDSSGALDGQHVVTATAQDTAGNVGAATPVLVQTQSGGPQPTLNWIQNNVFDVGCAAGCHTGGGIAAFLRLDDADNSFDELVNVPATRGGSSLRVTPFDADDSALVQRLEGTLTPAMPLGGAMLSADQIAAVRAWIDTGATAQPQDTVTPAVALDPPASAVSGQVLLTAFAVDNVAVASVMFLVDDAPIGTVTAAPYSVTWDSSTVADGDRRLRARVTDTSGNTSDSLEYTTAVANTSPLDQPGD